MYTPEKVEKMAEVIQTPTLAISIRRECAAMLRAYAATLKAAQGGVTNGAFAPIPEAKDFPTDELWNAYNAFNDRFCGFNTQQALRDAINTVLANRAALSAQQGQGEAVAWLHQVVAGDGEPDLALSFAADSFPLDTQLGFRSLGAVPLYTAPPAQQGQGEACGYRAKNNPDCFMGPAAVAAQKAMGWDVSTDPAWVPVYTAPPAQPAERVPEDTGRIDWMEANARSVSFGKAPTQGYWVHVQGIGYSGGSNRSLREAIDAARKAQAAELAPSPARGDGGEG